jgi:glucose-6-phosphate isomerase, archaeal
MEPAVNPFTAQIDLASGQVTLDETITERRLTDMRGTYLESHDGDDLVYQVFHIDVPELNCNINQCTTVLQPGKVGREYFMTKGHFHQVRDRSEVYVGLRGKGALILATEDGEHEVLWMEAGSVAYIPGGWAHRSVNVGDEPLVFYAAWIADAGHDYATIEQEGFPVLLVDKGDGKPSVVPNPRYGRA